MSLAPAFGAIAAAVLFSTTDVSFANVNYMSDFSSRYTTDEGPNNVQVEFAGVCYRRNSGVFGSGSAMQFSRDNGSAAVVSNTTDILLSNSDFTIETWFKADVAFTGTTYLMGRYFATSQRSWYMWYDFTNKRISFTYSTDGTTDAATAYFRLGATNDGVTNATLFDNNWHLISVTRTSGTIVVHVDGKNGANTASISTTAIFESGLTVYTMIGSRNNAAATKVASNLGVSFTANCTALLDEVRFTVGSARYSNTTYTPATAKWPRGGTNDASWSNVKLLLGFEDGGINRYGADATNALGTSAGEWTESSSSYQSLTEVVDADGFMKASGVVGLRMNYDANHEITGGSFTVELFKVKVTAQSFGSGHLFGVWGTTKCWRFAYSGTTIRFEYTTDGTTVQSLNFVTGLTAGTTYTMDLAVTWNGSSLIAYKDGVQTASATPGASIQNNTTAQNMLTWFSNANNGDGPVVSTRVKAARMTKAVRYTGSSYAVPSLPLPKS